MTSDTLWYVDIHNLYKNERYLDFWPSKEKPFTNNINSFSRFIIYSSILMAILHKKTSPLVVGILLLIFIYFSIDVENKQDIITTPMIFDEKVIQSNDCKKCELPTKNNPFSNYILGDNIDKKPACNYDDVKEDIQRNFNENLYKSVWDVFDKENSQRQFYSMPNTEIVNDQTSYAEWLYGNKFKKTCKTDYKVCTGREVGGASSGFNA